MVPYLGDFAEDATVYIMFNTFTSDDPSASCTITNFANTDVHVHKDDGLTQRNNAAGVTVSVDFDSITGSHMIKIDTSDNTVAGFWVTGSDYFVRIEGTTVDGATLNVVVAHFSIENRFQEVDVVKWLGQACHAVSENGVPKVDLDQIAGVVQSATDLKDFADTGYNPGTHSVDLVDTCTANTDMRGTDSAALASVLGALDDATAAGDPTEADTIMQYLKQLINILIGTSGIASFPAEAAPDDAVSLAEVIRAIHADVTGLNGDAMRGTDSAATAAKLLAYIQLLARSDSAIETDNSTELTEINADGGSGAGNFSAQTDSEEAIRDHVGDGTNLTEAGGTGDHLTAIDLPNQTMDITGSLSGSVGSVTGDVAGNVDGTVAGVTPATPANVATALTDIDLDHLVNTAVADEVANDSIIAKLVSKDATADWSDYSNQTESLEALRDGVLADIVADTGTTLDGILDEIRIALVNKMIITEANGNTEFFNESDVSQGSIAATFASDGTYTTRKRLVP